MVVAVLHVVEHPQFLEIGAALEGSVLDHHLQVAERVVRSAVGLPELNLLQLLVVLEGVAVNGDGLVVVVRARVVVDAQGTVVRLQVAVVAAHDAGVPDVLLVVRSQQAAGGKLLIVCVPQAQGLH